jgi:ABC-type branched-subunit amino acid transport system substrate-binding protein
MVGDYLAEHWADKEIAILDDGTIWGAGVANGVRRRLREHGVLVALDETLTPGKAEYFALVSKMQAAGVDVFFLGGLQREIGLVFRQAHDRGYDLRQVEKARAAAGAAYSAAREEAERQGLTLEGGKAAAGSAAEAVRHKAERVAKVATEAAKTEAERQNLAHSGSKDA